MCTNIRGSICFSRPPSTEAVVLVCSQLKLHYDCHIEAGSLLTSATPGCVAFAGPEKGRFMRRIIAEVPMRSQF